jgi:hypothetical protein
MKALTHEEAFELLPWFVNGTLADSEHAGVAQHVRSCLPCRVALQEQHQLQSLLEQQPTIPLSAEPAFDRLIQEIGDSRLRRIQQTRTPISLPRFLVPVRPLAITAAVLVISLGFASWLVTSSFNEQPEGEFSTLSATGASGFDLDIVFADGISESELRALVRNIDGVISGGPSDIGRYRVRVGAPPGDQADVDAVLEMLRDDERVRFVGRALSDEAGN